MNNPVGHQYQYRYGAPFRMTWVATPPPGVAVGPRPRPRPAPYLGPPAYPAAPRWGLPRLAWRATTAVPGAVARVPADAGALIRHARLATVILWAVGISALLAGGGEIWRYTLLVLGRDEALSAGVVAASDALVLTTALLAVCLGLAALVLTLRWLLTAVELAGEFAGYTPGRPTWQLLLGILLPVLNLFVAGSALAELEHAALGAPATDRPKPSRLVRYWWAAWAVSEVLAIGTLLLGLRSGLQAKADDVLWHAATDLVAVVVVVVTVAVLRLITGLLAPTGSPTVRLGRLIAVRDAPEPRLRPSRPAGALR
ncbi:MAG TPA: DUF4328 domain-containing protein [Pseudonocardiaceae bacterium]|jgi:hypothetical protein|nr:DUF4328 domain-containing protein [Pseudonocardiaceae bacterium]